MANRTEAMKLCDDQVGKALDEIEADRKLYDSNRARYEKLQEDDYKKWIDIKYDRFEWMLLLDSPDEKINILRGYCRPSPNKKFVGQWYAFGYVEYLRRPLDGFGESKVDRVMVAGTKPFITWEESTP